MSTEKKLNDVKILKTDNFQEDEKGTRQLLSTLSKNMWDDKSKGSKWYEWLQHPLVILIIGAIISSYLFPYLTRGWQDRQRGLDLKTSLINQINQTTEGTLAELETLEYQYEYTVARKDPSATDTLQNLFINQFHASKVQVETILSQLQAYFGSYLAITVGWKELGRTLSNFWYLSILSDTNARNAHIQAIISQINVICILKLLDAKSCHGLSFIHNLLPVKGISQSDSIVKMNVASWQQLEFMLRNIEDNLVGLILNTPISIRDGSS